jgi:hypothetical protein
LADLDLVAHESLQSARTLSLESGELLGTILLREGALDAPTLHRALCAQMERKLETIFEFPAETSYSYVDQHDELTTFGGGYTPVDPLPALWRGIREFPAWDHVDATLKRVGSASIRLFPDAQIDRFQFNASERTGLELLAKRPMRLVELASTPSIGSSLAQRLVYALVITKQVDLFDSAGPSPIPQMSEPQTRDGGSPSGHAFARVQLQSKPVQPRPLVVEEAMVHRATDGRLASPIPSAFLPNAANIPKAPGAPHIDEDAIDSNVSSAPGFDIGAMIETTIRESVPPPPASSQASVTRSSAAGPTSSTRTPLAAEHVALRQKILDKSAQISSQDYFEMLGVPRDASAEAVQKAFVVLAKVWHPDRLPTALADVMDSCSKVFTHLTEAKATLCDAERRADYMRLLADGGATPDDQAKIQAVLEAAMTFQKAEVVLKRNDTALARELAAKAYALDPEQSEYLAMLTWLDAQKPEWTTREKTLEKIAVLDGCIRQNANSERAYFWRGMLYKRIGESSKALKDFKKAGDLNPRNLDAIREVRLHNIRGAQSKPPPGGSTRPSAKPAPPETLGGRFGKLFKK